MAIANQGYRRDLNLSETENEQEAISNLMGTGIDADIRYLQNNQLTQINAPGTLASLSTYQAHNNAIVGDVPDFSGCSNVRSITLNNNKLTGYTIGALVSLYKIII